MRYHLHSETSRYGNFGNVNKMPSLPRNTVSQYMNNTDKYASYQAVPFMAPQSDIKCQTAITVISITTETTTNFDFSIEIHKIETLSSHRSENMLPVKLTWTYMNGEGL